jgi:hypothetical protein
MMDAKQELITLGVGAVPILASVLTGEAKNAFGVSYRTLGLPLPQRGQVRQSAILKLPNDICVVNNAINNLYY